MRIPCEVRGRLVLALIVLLALGLQACGSGEGPRGADGDGRDTTLAAEDTAAAGRDDDAEVTDEDEGDPVPVEITVLERGRIESVLRASTTLEAERQVEVLAEAARRVRELLVEEGDRVRSGQVLCRLQDAEQRSALALAESNLAKAERELRRQESLREQDLSSDQALSDARYAFDQRKIAVEDTKRELSYTEVRAPFAGTVTVRRVNLGDQVRIGQELFQLIDFESLVARIYVPEKNLKQLRLDQTARVRARAVTDEPMIASVLRIAPVVDARTGTVKVTVGVGGQPGLRPGLFVDVELVTEVHENALLVPKRALVYDSDQVFVYRLGDEREVERLLVVPVLSDESMIEPLTGLAEGDSIVIAGQTGLRDGVKVSLAGESGSSGETAQADTGGAGDDAP